MTSTERHALALTVLQLDRQLAQLEAQRAECRKALLAGVSRLADSAEEYPDGVRVTVVRATRTVLDRARLAEVLDLTTDELSAAWGAASVATPGAPHIRITSRR